MGAAEQFHVVEVSPSYWRVTFDNGEVNLLDPDTVEQLGTLVARMEADADLTVVLHPAEQAAGGDSIGDPGPHPRRGKLRSA